MNRIRVALFENPAGAKPLVQELVQAGLYAELRAEPGLAWLWFVSRRRAGVRVEVLAEDAARAVQLLRHWDATERWLSAAIRCPECKSFRVDYPQFTEKSLLTNVMLGLVAALGLIEREFYCEDCHYMWVKPGTRRVRGRSHLAPDYFLEDTQSPAVRSSSFAGGPVCRTRSTSPLEKTTGRQHGFGGWNRVKLRLAVLGFALPLSGALLALNAAADLNASQPGAPKFAVRTDRPAPAGSKSPTYLGDVLPILMGKCARCHNDETAALANWLDYRTAASKRWEIKRRVWDSWEGSYFKQPMPVANGPEAVAMTEEERQLIKEWVEGGAPRGAAPIYSSRLSKAEKIALGRRLFATICAACHQPTAQGIPGRFPPLAGSDFLNADKHRAIQTVVNGRQGDLVVNGQHFNNAMPKFPLTDQDIACALTFVYNSFGNSGKEVAPEEVSAVRNEKPEPVAAPISAKVPEEKSPYE